MGLIAPSMSLNLPGINADYSSLGNFGNINYSPVDNYMGSTPRLESQVGAVGTGTPITARPDFFSWEGFLGGKNTDGIASNGWGGAAFGALQGLGNAYMGMKQYGLARDQLAFSKDAFNKNYALQKSTIQGRIDGKARARYAADPGGSGSPNADAYVAQALSRYGMS